MSSQRIRSQRSRDQSNQFSGLSKSKGFRIPEDVIAFESSKHEFQHETADTHEAVKTETVTATTGGPERCIKGWPFARRHSLTVPHPLLFSPLLDLHPLSLTWTAASDFNGGQVTWRCRSWEVYDHHYDTYCTLCSIFAPRPSPDPALAHHPRPCFCTQVSHMTAEGCLCLSRGGWGKKGSGCTTSRY